MKEYSVALLIAFGLEVLAVGYLGNGAYQALTLDLLIKGVANVGAIMLGIAFLTGPLVRHFHATAFLLKYRKEIGIVAAFLVFAHALKWWIERPEYFFVTWFAKKPMASIGGTAGMLVLIALWVSSRERIKGWLGGKRWWTWQRWGLRIAIATAFVHVAALKLPEWQKWLESGYGVSAPPVHLLVTIFIAWVVFVRLVEYIALYPSHHVSIHHVLPIEVNPQLHDRHVADMFLRWFIVLSFCGLVALYLTLFYV